MADDKKKAAAKPAKGGAAAKGGAPKDAGKAEAKADNKKQQAQAKGGDGKGRGDGGDRVQKGEPAVMPKDYKPRLKKMYDEVIKQKLVEEFKYENALQVPVIEKIVLNMGVGEAVNDTKRVTAAASDLALIAGQKPIVTRARKAISTFKVRENMPIGAKVTLRKTRMYEFLDRLVNIALPRVRDFRGCNPKSFDGRGNYALGIKEHIIFPEIDYDKTESILGMDIIVCTTAKTDEEARALLREFNFPFRQ